MNKKIQKLITIVSIVSLLSIRIAPAVAYEVPQAPQQPSAPSAPQAPSVPSAPESPSQTSDSNGSGSSNNNDKGNREERREKDKKEENSSETSPDTTSQNSPSQIAGSQPSTQVTPSQGEQTGNQNQDSQVGNTDIATGNATNSVKMTTSANDNLSAGVGNAGGTGATISNSGNGSDSTNTGSATVTNGNSTTQNNSANVANDLKQTTTTGDNSASKNTGGDVNITTGDANTTGTIITSVNTNVDGVAVAEFNIADDHIGDIVLDFGTGCIVGCGGGSVNLENKKNGSDSGNTAALNGTTNNTTFQNNDATIGNSMVLSSNSGDNNADKNTGGNTKITTGDANIGANALTFANNNISGNVVYGVVNIFGDLKGDIIMPEGFFNSVSCTQCLTNPLLENSGNGSDSKNNTALTQNTNNQTLQANLAKIENVILVDAETGQNGTSKNTDGNNTIKTGNTTVDAGVLNVANSNVSGGNWWLVIVNEAGNWIGKILGSPDGANLAGSNGTEFSVNPNGEITATNSGNGSGSDNNASLNQATNNTTTQTNTANIVNTLDLSANTGGNSASKNTGGNSQINTGNVKVIANLVNFVNNNITGGGKLFVTVVNVFGSWLGDFVTPGHEKDKQNQQNQAQGSTGGSNTNNNSQGGSSGSNSNSNNGSGGQSSTNNQNTTVILNPVIGGNNTAAASNNAYNSPVFLAEQISANSSNPGEVLGQQEFAANKKVKINLAWALLVLPFIGAGLYLKFKPAILARFRKSE